MSIHILDHDESRTVLLYVSSEADQDRAIDALDPLGDTPTAGEERHKLAEQLVIPDRSAVVAVIAPVTVAEAMRTVSLR